MSLINELKKTTRAHRKKQKKDSAYSDRANRKYIEAEASRLLSGWKKMVKEEAAKGWNCCDIVETGWADGVEGKDDGYSITTTVVPGCPFDLIKKKMQKLGFKVEIWSSYSNGSRSWDYDDAGWTYGIRIHW